MQALGTSSGRSAWASLSSRGRERWLLLPALHSTWWVGGCEAPNTSCVWTANTAATGGWHWGQGAGLHSALRHQLQGWGYHFCSSDRGSLICKMGDGDYLRGLLGGLGERARDRGWPQRP